MSEWIDIRIKKPPRCANYTIPYVLAYHSIYGIGVAWFWDFEEDKDQREMLEEEFKDKYICSARFIKNKVDGNYGIDDEDFIDIFEHSPHFFNLGTITHWQPLPPSPKVDIPKMVLDTWEVAKHKVREKTSSYEVE